MYERIIEIISRLEHLTPTKEDTRARLLAQRAECVRLLPKSVRAEESRALSLLRRPTWQNVKPTLRRISETDLALWHYLRVSLSSAPWRGRPGRIARYFVMDDASGGILGVADIGSDVQTLGPRDRWVGWTQANRMRFGGLRRSMNLGTCVCSQPFGWLCGGKYMAEAAASQEVAHNWQLQYGDVPAICTTTSLYGKSSQYNRLPNWQFLGLTEGSSPHMYLSIADRQELARLVGQLGLTARSQSVASFANPGSAMDVLATAIKASGYKGKLAKGQPRGVYVSELYEGARDDLRTGILGGAGRADRPLASVQTWWIDRWRVMRWDKVREQIAGFDWNNYRLDRVVRAGGVASDTSAPPGGRGMGSTSPALRLDMAHP